MSPETTTAPDTTEVITRVLARRFPRAHATMVVEGDLVRVPQAPEPDLLFKVTLHGRTAQLQRLDPESHDPWPGAQPEQVPIPEPGPEPVATATPTPSLLNLAERLTQATTSAHGQLQAVATTEADEVARLQALASTFDPAAARDHLSNLVAQGLSSYLTYEATLSEALRMLETVKLAQAVTAQAIVELRTSNNLATLGQIHQHEAKAREQRLGVVELQAALHDALLYREAYASTAARLAVASLEAAAGLQVTRVTARLLTLKQAVAALRADALVLPPALLAATAHFAQQTGRAVPVPRLFWNSPKDPWAPPVIAPE